MPEQPHPLPSGASVLPSVAWASVRTLLAMNDGKVDVVLLTQFDATVDRISKGVAASGQPNAPDAMEIVKCGLAFRRAQLDRMAEREGRDHLIDRRYAVATRGGC